MKMPTLFITGALVLGIAATAPANAGAAFLEAAEMPVSLSASQTTEPVLSIEAGLNMKCKKASYTGTQSEASSEVTLAPSFSECTAFGLAATVTTTGCKFILHAALESESEPGKFPGSSMDVSCEAGKALIVSAGTCEVQIGAQNGLGSVTLVNNASSPADVTTEMAIEKAVYNKTKDGALCPLNGTGVKEDGKLTGNSLLIGKIAEVKVQMMFVDHTVLCTELVGKVCAKGKNIPHPIALEGNATDFQVVANWNDGKGNSKNMTISCAKAKFTATATGYTKLFGLDLHTNLETFSTETCKDENKAECTVEGREVPTNGNLAFDPKVDGNGKWTVTLKIRVECATAKLKCDYGSKTAAPEFQGNAVAAKLKANAVALDFEKRTGEENCGTTIAAKVSVTYTLNIAAFLRRQ